MSEQALAQLSDAGVAIWLDDISRDRLATGNLEALIRDKHVVGVTSNPTIFQKAVHASERYNDQVHDLATRRVTVDEALHMITATDIRWACDQLRPVYDATDGVDGRVSLEVDPRLARDTETTVAEARQLWWLVDRPNLFIKIPATREGLPAISQCLSEGISINVTLIFSLQRYREVMDAFLDGVERLRANDGDLTRLGSVASFFVSRVDTEVDKRLDKIGSEEAKALRGQAGIANARLAYQEHERVFGSERWRDLAAAGGHPQRPLWASTGVKDPEYDDTRYVMELVAPGIVNTMPEATLDAVFDHGVFRGETIRPYYAQAKQVLDDLASMGIDYDDVVQVLEDEGVEKFEKSWLELLDATQEQLDAAKK
jgi:transaldolase